MKYAAVLIFLAIVVLCHQNIFSQWTNNPSLNTPVCVWNGNQYTPEINSDEKGGVIIVWDDSRSGEFDLFIQRMDEQGFKILEDSGKVICGNSGHQVYHKIIQDSEGGCFVVWEDTRNGNSDIYAQRVDSSGNILWDFSGVEICVLPLDQEDPQIVSDGSDGAIIMWEFKQGAAGETGLYAQRINSLGQIMWAVNGLPIATSPTPDPIQIKPKLTSDGSGGAVIVWTDFSQPNDNIFAQRINSSGMILWPQNGLPIVASSFGKRFNNLIGVGNGEFVLCWVTNIDILFNDWDLRAQKIDTSGNLLWNSEGIVICSTGVSINPSAVAYDNQSSVIIGWEDRRHIPTSNPSTIYCQKLSLDGYTQWQQNGRPVSSFQGNQARVKLICDSNGNTVACWFDARTNPVWDIYAQKFDGSGTILWEVEGREVSIANSYKTWKNIAITNNEDYIVTWGDERNADPDIYAQSLNCLITSVDNSSSQFAKSFVLNQNYPNPFNPSTKISWQVPTGSQQTLKIYDVLGNEVATLVDEYKPAGSYEVAFNASLLNGSVSAKGGYASGVYFYQLRSADFIETKKMILVK